MFWSVFQLPSLKKTFLETFLPKQHWIIVVKVIPNRSAVSKKRFQHLLVLLSILLVPLWAKSPASSPDDTAATRRTWWRHSKEWIPETILDWMCRNSQDRSDEVDLYRDLLSDSQKDMLLIFPSRYPFFFTSVLISLDSRSLWCSWFNTGFSFGFSHCWISSSFKYGKSGFCSCG